TLGAVRSLQHTDGKGDDDLGRLRRERLREKVADDFGRAPGPTDFPHQGMELKADVASLEGSRQGTQHTAIAAQRPELRGVEHSSRGPLLGYRESTDSFGIRGVESFDERLRHFSGLRGDPVCFAAGKKLSERDVTAAQLVHRLAQS